MSEAAMGKKNHMFGIKRPPRSKTWCKKISESKKGKKRPPFSEEWKRKMSESRTNRWRGEKSWSWRGGLTLESKRIRNSIEYKVWRKTVFERDNYTCVCTGCAACSEAGCGKRGGRLNADHIKSFSKYPNLRFDISNGRTLCKPCHEKTPNFAGRASKEK